MDFTFLGGAREVGKSCVLLESKDANIMFDSGVKLTEPPSYPLPARDVDLLLLSHAHLDHCGNIPAVHRKQKFPVYSTSVSLELSHVLQHDSLKITKLKGYPARYSDEDVDRLSAGEIPVEYDRDVQFHRKISFRFIDAGHVPGSAGILVGTEGKTVFYTGDTKDVGTKLLDAGKYPKHADIVICESTYGNRLHPDRRDAEEKMLGEIEEALDRGGWVILPVFAVGRAQEMLLLLQDIGHTVYLDGMAQTASEITLRHSEFLRTPERLEQAMNEATWVKSRRHRREILDGEPGIIVTTAGMIEGGPVIDYISKLYNDANSNIILTGYQVEGTNGRKLVQQGFIVDYETKRTYKVKMNISKYDFSAHADQKGLASIVRDMSPEVVFLVHGDFDSCEALRHEIGGGFRVYMPHLGEKISV